MGQMVWFSKTLKTELKSVSDVMGQMGSSLDMKGDDFAMKVQL